MGILAEQEIREIDGRESKPSGDDLFFNKLDTMLPQDVARSFNDVQRKAIATAFGTRRWRDHTIDFRWLIPLFGRNYYFVALAGGERRSAARRLRDRLLLPMVSIGNGIFAAVFFTGILLSVLVTLYLLKSLLGINLLPDVSLGIMPIIMHEFEMLFG